MPAASAMAILLNITWLLHKVSRRELIAMNFHTRQYFHKVCLTASLQPKVCGNAKTVCHKLPFAYKMQKCSCCFVTYCSSACQWANWNLHKPLCKILTMVRETHSRSSRKARKYKTMAREWLKTGKGFQIIDKDTYVRLRSLLPDDPRAAGAAPRLAPECAGEK